MAHDHAHDEQRNLQHRDHSRHDHQHHDPSAMAELLELDREVLQPYVAELTSWLAGELDAAPRRIVDLGPGTGSGTIALARQFTTAEIVAVDRSRHLLDVLLANVAAAGVADRVHMVEADLDTGWPDVGPIDLAWASLSLHEVAEADRVFPDVLAALRPGGAFVVTELDAPPRFLLDVDGTGLEARLHAALRAAGGGGDPHPDWAPHLRAAGFDVTTRRFDLDLTPAQPAVGRYAEAYLRMLRPHLERHAAADDLAALDHLLAFDSLAVRTDLVVRGSRTTWIARRPPER